MIFKLMGNLIIDESKPTVIFMDKGNHNSYTHIYGPARIVKENIKDKYNIITIGAGCGLTDNYYELQRGATDSLLRKEGNGPDYKEKNAITMRSWLDDSFVDLPVVDHIILGTDDFFRLPLQRFCGKEYSEFLYNMQNEFFDYIGTDSDIIQKIDEMNTDMTSNWDKRVSPYAFSTKDYFWFMECIGYINKVNKLNKELIAFSIDPAIYTPYFDKMGIKTKLFYFADDARGTRNFQQLDISQLQHIIYDEKFKPKTLDSFFDDEVKKTHNMFFAGTLFQDKGSRRFIWDKFLKDVKSDDCSYYIPLRKNGINKSKDGRSERAETTLKETAAFTELYNNVIEHKNYKEALLPSEVNDKTKRYKYGMIFRCVSINDSLNFRPVLYAYSDIVPFLDTQYDPDCLQIPKHIQEKLLVANAWDIDERIKYFNDNDSVRIEILNELKDLFNINQYINDPQTAIDNQIKKIFN
jgi:hypothetical protein